MSSCLFFLLVCLAAVVHGTADLCSCTYTGFAGDKCGNNPSVSVSLPKMTEGECTQISGFEEGYFDLEGLSFAGTSIASIICDASAAGQASSSSNTTSTNATSSTNLTNSTDNSTSSSANTSTTSNNSSATCPGTSVVTDYQSFTVVSCQGNEASVRFYQGTTCSGNGFTITLTKGKCTNLVEVTSLGWISYQLKCNRGGGSNSGNGALNLNHSWSPLIASLLLFYFKMH